MVDHLQQVQAAQALEPQLPPIIQKVAAGCDALFNSILEKVAGPMDAACASLRNMEPGKNHLAGLMGAAKDSLPSFGGGTDSEVAMAPSKSPQMDGPRIERAITPGIEKNTPQLAAACEQFKSCVAISDHGEHTLGQIAPTHIQAASMYAAKQEQQGLHA